MEWNKLLESVKEIDLTKVDSDTIVLSDDADKAIHGVLEAEKYIKEAKEKLQEKFLAIAQKNPNLKSYEGDYCKVGYRVTRRKVVVGEPDKKFYEIDKKPVTKAIEIYRDATGKLPEGIEEKTFEFISFRGVK